MIKIVLSLYAFLLIASIGMAFFDAPSTDFGLKCLGFSFFSGVVVALIVLFYYMVTE